MLEISDPDFTTREALRCHNALKAHFQESVEALCKDFQDSKHSLRDDISIGFTPGDNEFRILIADRRLRILFSSALIDTDGDMTGRVTCYLCGRLNKDSLESIGDFTFNRQGLTNLKTVRSPRIYMKQRSSLYDSSYDWILLALQKDLI